jgi:hypothetical protein
MHDVNEECIQNLGRENLEGRDHMVNVTGLGRITFIYICEYAGAMWNWI